MRFNRALLALIATGCVVMAALTVFAVELSNNQIRSRQEIERQIRDRAVLAAALIDSLFNASAHGYQTPGPTTDAFFSPTVTTAEMDRLVGQNTYLAVLDSTGRVIARSSSLTAPLQDRMLSSVALSMVRSGRPYGFGNASASGASSVLDFAVPVHTVYGNRMVVVGFAPQALEALLVADLRAIPGVSGEANYIVDGNGVVLASGSPEVPFGSRVAQAGALTALGGGSPDRNGTYFEHRHLVNSTWQVVLAAPDRPLFASVTGIRQLVPWLVFGAFALMAAVALVLGWRVLRTAAELQESNDRLAGANRDLLGANTALEQRAAELARSNEELDQFASIASHDLQEPLRKVRTFTEQLSVTEGERLSEKGRDYLARSNAAAERMQKLIEDLLRFSRVSTQGRPFTPVDLAETARAVVDDLDSQIAETGATVRIGDLPAVDADPLQMQQLLQNLVSNALKFRREGVRPEVEIDAIVGDSTVALRVRDNGIGFEPRYAQRIFRIFERLHGRSEYPGTGIGLALCRKIADRHGGTITAHGVPGRGATFTVILPRVHGQVRQSAPSDQVAVADRAPAGA